MGYTLPRIEFVFRMPKYTWIIACSLTAVVLLALLGFTVYDKSQELAQVQVRLTQAKAALQAEQGTEGGLKADLAKNQTRVEQLEKEQRQAKTKTAQTHRKLEQEMRAALESKDVTISQLQGKLTVTILDRILFASGQAALKPEGVAVLRKVASILAAHTDLMVHVIGHTDNVPISPWARNRFPSNWELSTARATAAVRCLIGMGVDPRRLGAVGYAEYRPIADNSTPEGRARNRRIAITIMSDEMAGADTVPLVTTNKLDLSLASVAGTNAPAPQIEETNQTGHTSPTSPTAQTNGIAQLQTSQPPGQGR